MVQPRGPTGRDGACFLLAFVAAFLAAPGCASHPYVAVDMEYVEATRVLAESGAREEPADAKTEAGGLRFHTWDLGERGLLRIGISNGDSRIRDLRLCTNPKEPQARRVWIPVTKVLARR